LKYGGCLHREHKHAQQTQYTKNKANTPNKASTANAQPPLQTSKYIIKHENSLILPNTNLHPIITLNLAFRYS